MVVVGRSADVKRERGWHLAVPMLIGSSITESRGAIQWEFAINKRYLRSAKVLIFLFGR
jgi:hypothetical protein